MRLKIKRDFERVYIVSRDLNNYTNLYLDYILYGSLYLLVCESFD